MHTKDDEGSMLPRRGVKHDPVKRREVKGKGFAVQLSKKELLG